MGDFKNSVPGIIFLGVISSLIAAYLWSHWETYQSQQPVTSGVGAEHGSNQSAIRNQSSEASTDMAAKSGTPPPRGARGGVRVSTPSGGQNASGTQNPVNPLAMIPASLWKYAAQPEPNPNSGPADSTKEYRSAGDWALAYDHDILAYLIAAHGGQDSLKDEVMVNSSTGEVTWIAKEPEGATTSCIITQYHGLFCILRDDKKDEIEDIYSELIKALGNSIPQEWQPIQYLGLANPLVSNAPSGVRGSILLKSSDGMLATIGVDRSTTSDHETLLLEIYFRGEWKG